jgi:YaiO family outer membrane protein
MKPILLSLALLLTAPALLAQDYDSLIREALELRNAGDLTGAEARLREAWPLAADKSEVAYLLGMVLAFQERYDEAQAMIDAALVDYPDNADLKEAQIRIRDFQAANSSEASPTASAADALSHEVTLGFSRSEFSRSGFSQWNDRSVEYRHLQPDGDQQFVRASHNHRFGEHDSQLEAGLLLGQDKAWPLELSAGIADSADFVADWFVRTATRRLLSPDSASWGALVFTPLYQYSSFNNGDTQRVHLGLEYYLPTTDLWLTPALGMVRDQDGENSFAWSIGAHWQAGVRNRFGGSYSDAPETENLLTTDTRSYSLYWRHQLADDWTVVLSATRVDRAAAYKRDEYSLVLQHRF